MPKKSEVCDLYKQACAFVKNAQVVYIFPTALSCVFWVVLKSIKARYLMISLNSHSTDTCTVDGYLQRVFEDELSTDRLGHHIYKVENH